MNRKQVTAALLAGTLLLAPTTAWAEANTPAQQSATADILSLPMQILDFDRDNLFFEYTLNNGLDFTKAGNVEKSDNNVDYTSGLVNATLGANGTPQYTEDAKAKIASLVADAAAAGDHKGERLYDQVTSKVITGEKNEHADALGSNDAANKELNQWKSSDAKACWTADDRLMHMENGGDATAEMWYFGGDHLVFPKGSTAVVYQDISVEKGAAYNYSCWANYGVKATLTMKAEGTEQELSLANQNVTNRVQIPNNVDTVRISFTPADTNSDSDLTQEGNHELLAFYFTKDDGSAVNTNNLFDDTNRTKWGTGNTQLWHREGDGAICDDPSVTLNRDFSVISGSRCTIKYWTGAAGTVVTVKAGDAVIAENTSDGQNFFSFTFDVPQNASTINVNIAAAKGVKVSAMNVTSYACKVGNDDATAADTAANWNSWDEMINASDLTTRQYTEFVLNRLFVPTEGLNTKVDAYDHLILQKAEDGSYVFDSANDVRYDQTNKAIYNTNAKDANGDPVLSNGFFPVDNGLGNGQITTTADTQGEHNFHFTLHSGGNFVYREAKDLFFDFSGDDDVYLFINGRLALDLGGAHLQANKSIKLNDMVEQLGLREGQNCTFDLFYMERHTSASNLKINTNIDVRDRVDVGDKVYQKVTFVFDNLTTTPQDLYVQAYKDGQKMGYPQKYAPTEGTWDAEDLTSQWELPTGSNYTFELVNADGSIYTDEEGHTYTLTTSGETIVSTDANGITKTYVYTLRQKPANNGDNAGNNNNSNTGSNGGSSTQQPAKTSTSTTVKSTATAPAAKAAPQTASIPQTSDAGHPVLLGILCVASAFGFGIVLAKKKYHT